MRKLIVCAAVLCAAACFAESAKSAYVGLLKPGQAFAPAVEEASGAGHVPVVDTDEVFPAAFVEDFEVDGDVTKAVWQKAKSVPPPCPVRSTTPIPYKTDIRMVYSKTALYVAATLWQDMSKMVCKWDQRDQPVWADDNVEIFMYIPSEKGNRLYQYVVNPLGIVADICDDNRAYWTRGMKVKANRYDDRWTFEWKFPFKGIPVDRPVAGDFFGVRFCRTVHEPKRGVGTVPTLKESGHGQRKRFAKLLFSAPEGEGAEKALAEGEAYRKDAFRKRFYARYAEARARFDEVRGCAAAFARSKHPLHVKAWSGVHQMDEAYSAFEKRFAAELAAEKPVPEDEAKAILALATGFERFASQYAYAVWQDDPWKTGSPDDLPPADAPTMPRPLMFEQAGNEREAVCLDLHGLLCGARLDLRLWPQTVDAKGKPYFRTDSIEIYAEPFVRVEGDVITAPLVRAAGNVVTVSPGKTVRVWAVFNSRGVKSGRYDTMLSFKSMNDLRVADRSLAVGAKVWGFDLPETRQWPIKSFFWGPFQFNEDEVALLELMHDYHVTHAWTQHHRYQYGMKEDLDKGYYWSAQKGKAKRDPEHDFDDDVALRGNEAFLRRAKELGMRFVIGWGTPNSLPWFQVMTKRFLDMGFEYEDFVYKGLIRDEFARKDIPTSAARREAVWNWNTNLWFQAVYLSTPPPTGATMDDIEAAKLPEFYKMWTVIRGRCRDPKEGPDTIGRLKAKGCKVWSYNCQRFMHNQKILPYYRFYPWECRLMDLEGCAIWTIYSPQGDGWDSRDGFDDGIAWRGVDRKPIPTKRLEAVREGLEDVAYMDRLEKELARLKAKGLSFPQYEALLAARADIVKAEDQKRVDEWRLAVGRAVDSLVATKRREDQPRK